jgi:hypothetical protein
VRPPGESAGGNETSAATGTPAGPVAAAGSASTLSAPAPAASAASPAGALAAPTTVTSPTSPKAAGQRKNARAHRRLLGAKRTPAGAVAASIAGALGVGVATIGPRLVAARVVHPLAAPTAAAVRGSDNLLESIGRRIYLPVPVPDWSKPIILALLVLAIWLGIRSWLEALRAGRLERQRAGLLSDVGAMQAALVPQVPARIGGLAVSVAYRPAEGPAAGGDFYDVFETEPGTVVVILGDVAGHGHDALTHAALTRYTLRAYMQAGLEPRAALALAGRVLVDRTGERFATVAVGIYDSDACKLTYALAGHPPPILHGYEAHAPLTVCSSPPIGWGRPTGRRQTTVWLPAGAEACFFSDGLIEARSNGELLGRERLGEILAGLGSRPAATELLERVRAATEGAPDDMVACVLSPQSGRGGELDRVEEIEVDAAALSGGEPRRFLELCGLAESEIARAMELAHAIAASSGTAVIRVKISPAGARTTVAPRSSAGRARPLQGVQSGEEPLLEALAVG